MMTDNRTARMAGNPCRGCGYHITWAEQRRQYARAIQRYDATPEARKKADAAMPEVSDHSTRRKMWLGCCVLIPFLHRMHRIHRFSDSIPTSLRARDPFATDA